MIPWFKSVKNTPLIIMLNNNALLGKKRMLKWHSYLSCKYCYAIASIRVYNSSTEKRQIWKQLSSDPFMHHSVPWNYFPSLQIDQNPAAPLAARFIHVAFPRYSEFFIEACACSSSLLTIWRSKDDCNHGQICGVLGKFPPVVASSQSQNQQLLGLFDTLISY